MNLEISKKDKSVVLKIREHKLDANISPELKAEFLMVCKPNVKEIILDLSDVEYCDSSGLSALLLCERIMREHKGKVKLVGVSEKVLNLIKIVKLDHLFEFYPSVESALGLTK